MTTYQEKKLISAHKLFLLMFLTCGMLYLFAVPILQVSDETQHYLRSYEIAVGRQPQILQENRVGDTLPGNLIPEELSQPEQINYKKILNSFDERIEPKEKCEYFFSGAALYSPFSYFPQALGIFVARLFTDRAVFILYACRLCNLLIVAVMAALAIKLFPFSKALPCLLLFTPIFVHKAATMSADGFTLSVIFLFVSYILYLKYEASGRITGKQLLPVYVLVFLLSQCKIVYLPVCILFLILSPARFGKRIRYLSHLFLLVMLALGSGLVWLAISSGYLNAGYSNSAQQITALVTNPIEYIKILMYTFKIQSKTLAEQMVGIGMGMGKIRNSSVLVYGYLTAIVATAIFAKRGKEKNNQCYDSGIFLVAAFCVVMLTCAALYIQWTAPGSPMIMGLQGRYFLPVLLLVCLAVMQFTFLDKMRVSFKNRFVLIYAFFINLIAVFNCFSYGFALLK